MSILVERTIAGRKPSYDHIVKPRNPLSDLTYTAPWCRPPQYLSAKTAAAKRDSHCNTLPQLTVACGDLDVAVQSLSREKNVNTLIVNMESSTQHRNGPMMQKRNVCIPASMELNTTATTPMVVQGSFSAGGRKGFESPAHEIFTLVMTQINRAYVQPRDSKASAEIPRRATVSTTVPMAKLQAASTDPLRVTPRPHDPHWLLRPAHYDIGPNSPPLRCSVWQALRLA